MDVIVDIRDGGSTVFSLVNDGSSHLVWFGLFACRVWLQFLSVRSTVQNMAKNLTNTSDSVS